jgi:L-lysine 6-transaminase
MIDAQNVHGSLSHFQMVDGYPLVLDLEKSHGVYLRDQKTGTEFIDCFTCFASWPLGWNHPGMNEPTFEKELAAVAKQNPANSDLYTVEMARFVEAFGTKVSPAGFEHHFWVAGGSLAVENAMKTAFDWKARKLGITDMLANVNDLSILHFNEAFHGRSGYTMSVTNTLPDKVGLFPKFDWPRVHNPKVEFDLDGNVTGDIAASEAKSLAEIEAAFAERKGKIAAILIEPMQGEGGDNHFRTEFLQKLREIADQNEALLIFDEVQTGFFGSGKPWLWQTHNVRPDIVCFGKKSQVCGIYAGPRVDEVKDNVFHKSSRINSTWGGNLVDMVRSRRFIEIITENKLADNAAARGAELVAGLRGIAKDKGGFTNVRGKGSLVAFTCTDPSERAALLKRMMDRQLMALPCGKASVRFRLPLVVSAAEIGEVLSRVESSVATAAK